MPPTFLDRSWPNLARKIAPKSIELTDFEISSFSRPICQQFWQAFLIWIARAAVLLLELERLYESCNLLSWGRMRLSRRWAPGRAAQIDLELTSERFLEKSQLFGVMKKPIRQYNFFYNA